MNLEINTEYYIAPINSCGTLSHGKYTISHVKECFDPAARENGCCEFRVEGMRGSHHSSHYRFSREAN
jgi:hypothetical protein